jgi:hypothetical protein
MISAHIRRLTFAAILLVAAFALRWHYARPGGGGFISDDGIQYMGAASNFAAGQCLCINFAHFDEQVAHGRLPVPLTHFPPGYPLLIAAVTGVSGMPVESAALLLAAAGHLISLALLWILATVVLDASRPIAAGVCLLWALHSDALFYATATSTEPLFTALVLLTCLGLSLDLKNDHQKPQFAVLAAAAAGFSYWIRYPGLFLVAGTGLYLAWRLWMNRRPRNLLWTLAAFASMTLLTSAVMLRNLLLSGSWRGGFDATHSPHTLSHGIRGAAKAVFHIVFGERSAARFDFWALLFVLASATMAWIAVRGRLDRESIPRRTFVWLAILAGLYAAAILAATMVTAVGAFSRFYLPFYPVVLAMVAAFCTRIPASLTRNAALLAIATAIVAIQARSLAIPPGTTGPESVRQALLSGNPNLLDWIVKTTGPDDVLVSVHGQAVHYVTKRPVVSIPDPIYTNRTDDEAGVRRLMERFGSRYLVVFPGMNELQVPEQHKNPFLKGLAAADKPLPAWLREAVRNSEVRILETVVKPS